MNQKNKNAIENYYRPQKSQLLKGTLIKTGEGRSDEDKEANFREIQENIVALGVNNKADVADAAKILGLLLGRVVETKEPPIDNGVARKLVELDRDSSSVRDASGFIRLDNDQLKHQHPKVPIGTRAKGGGNRFVFTCDAAWHRTTTLAHMSTWANNLRDISEGEKRYHGQSVPVDGIHYEGYCLLANGNRYVLFHCYPGDKSPLKL